VVGRTGSGAEAELPGETFTGGDEGQKPDLITTALALPSCASALPRDAVREAATWLAGQQLPDGSFSDQTDVPMPEAATGSRIATGIAMNYFAFPFGSQPLHLILAAILFGVQGYLYLEIRSARKASISS